MKDGPNLLTGLAMLGAAQGYFLTAALLNAKSGNFEAHRILAMFTFLLSVDLSEELLYQIGFFETVPDLLLILAPIDLLYGPILLLYVFYLTDPLFSLGRKTIFWHSLPALMGVLLLLPFFTLLDGQQKVEITESLRNGAQFELEAQGSTLIRLGTTLFSLLTVVQIGLYLLFAICRLVGQFSSRQEDFSEIARINLMWLRNLIIGLTIMFILYLADQFFPNYLGVNFLGDSITGLAVILIYVMGYLGLKQSKIFSEPLFVEHANTENCNNVENSKYIRSGLNKDSSKLFLNDLLMYMEKNKPYLDTGLALNELAQSLGISANYLSQIVNEQLDMNFHDFVNGYRIEEAKRLIETRDSTNILDISLDSGFNSKSAFYNAFKKATSMTPTQFRKTVG